MALILKDILDAQTQLDMLQWQAAESGFQISYKQTKFMTDIKTAPDELVIGT